MLKIKMKLRSPEAGGQYSHFLLGSQPNHFFLLHKLLIFCTNSRCSLSSPSLDAGHQQMVSMWQKLHVDLKSLLSWQYLMKDFTQIRSWNITMVRLRAST